MRLFIFIILTLSFFVSTSAYAEDYMDEMPGAENMDFESNFDSSGDSFDGSTDMFADPWDDGGGSATQSTTTTCQVTARVTGEGAEGQGFIMPGKKITGIVGGLINWTDGATLPNCYFKQEHLADEPFDCELLVGREVAYNGIVQIYHQGGTAATGGSFGWYRISGAATIQIDSSEAQLANGACLYDTESGLQ